MHDETLPVFEPWRIAAVILITLAGMAFAYVVTATEGTASPAASTAIPTSAGSAS